MPDKTHKVFFIGPQEIAGFQTRMAITLAESGHKVFAFRQIITPYQPSICQHPNITWMFHKSIVMLSGAPGVLRYPVVFWLKIFVLIQLIYKSDACLFIGGKGLFNFPLDYYLLRAFGKRVVHMFVGTASRPRSMSAYALDVLKPDHKAAQKALRKLKRRLVRQKRRVSRISHAATYVIDNPLCGHFLTKPFINIFTLGIPVEGIVESVVPEVDTVPNHRRIRILHCPSRPEIKGTARILEILNQDRLNELNAELVVLTGVPRTRVIEELKLCDFVIDQLYSDSPLAGFAAEAVMYSRLPVIGGYGWDELRKHMPESAIPPACLCHPDQLLHVVSQLCQNNELRQQKLHDLQNFLTYGPWSKTAFAHRMGIILSGDIPPDWLIQPRDINYSAGVGLTLDQSHRIQNLLDSK